MASKASNIGRYPIIGVEWVIGGHAPLAFLRGAKQDEPGPKLEPQVAPELKYLRRRTY